MGNDDEGGACLVQVQVAATSTTLPVGPCTLGVGRTEAEIKLALSMAML